MQRRWNLIRVVLVNVRGKCERAAGLCLSSVSSSTAEQDQTVAGTALYHSIISYRMTKNNILFTQTSPHRYQLLALLLWLHTNHCLMPLFGMVKEH